MATRTIRRRRLKKYSVGDMRERITLHTRAITPPAFGSASFTETYDSGIACWASVETPNAASAKVSVFGGVALPEGTTHVFIIRFDASITLEDIIRWEGDAYSILGTIDPDKRQQYLELPAKLLGDHTLAANT